MDVPHAKQRRRQINVCVHATALASLLAPSLFGCLSDFDRFKRAKDAGPTTDGGKVAMHVKDSGPGSQDAGNLGTKTDGSGGTGGSIAKDKDSGPGSMDAGHAGAKTDGSGGTGGSTSSDPCATNNGGCDPLVTCAVSGGSVTCGSCPSGYGDTNSNGKKCTDIDECTKQTDNCTIHSTCLNTPGSYDCPCDMGYHGDGHQECLANPLCNATGSNCGSLASCTDISGTRYCVCGSGYEGDGVTCMDINECATNNGGCGSATYALCTNNTGATPTCTAVDVCSTNNGGCGSATYWTCTNNTGAAPTCATIDVCATNNGGCGDAAHYACTNNGGSAPSCGDVNECAGTNVCTADDPCLNLNGCYTCRGQFADWTPVDSPTFTNNGNGTVTDTRSGLVWEVAPPSSYPGCSGNDRTAGDTCTWAEAKTYCSGLSLAGASWRLPTKAELESIVDFGRFADAIDPVFSNLSVATAAFWSSSATVDPVGYAWYVVFTTGQAGSNSTDGPLRVRCVR